MASPSRIVTLATRIERNTRAVDSYLREKGIPSPSFEPSCPADISLPPQIARHMEMVLEAMDELEALLLGPVQKIVNDIIIKPTTLASIHGITRWKLAVAVPLNGSIPLSGLAALSGLAEEDCTRIVRHGLTNRLFLEPSSGVIAHSAMTAALLNVPLLARTVEHPGDAAKVSAWAFASLTYDC